VVLCNLGSFELRIYRFMLEAGNQAAADAALAKAMAWHKACVAMAVEADDRDSLSRYYLNLAEAHLYAGLPDEAETYLSKAREMDQARADLSMHWSHLRVQAELALARGEVQQAILHANEALARWPTHPLARYIHATLHEAHRRLGQVRQALEHSEAAHRLDMRLMTVQLKAQSEYMVSRFERDTARSRAARAEEQADVQRELARTMSSAANRDPLHWRTRMSRASR
jgi:tetratricopeptide (TPR) repeat protein